MQKYILSNPDHLLQSSYFVAVQIDQVIFTKWRPNKERVQWTSQNHFASCLGQVEAGSSEGIYVHMEK